MRLAFVFLVVAILSSRAYPQAAPAAPMYQRTRNGAGDWHSRGGQFQHWRGGNGYGPGPGYGGAYNPYFSTFAQPPIVAGSYYQRPYPYHFDYYRSRWSTPPYEPDAEMMPVSDCPCLAPQPAAGDLPASGAETPSPGNAT